MTPCSLIKCTNVLDKPVTPIITADSSEMLAHSYQTTWPHMSNAFRCWAHKAHDLRLHITNTLDQLTDINRTYKTAHHEATFLPLM